MGSTTVNVWDPRVEVEHNAYNWAYAPAIRYLPTFVPRIHSPVHVDLFCGAGGFSAGFSSAGFFTSLGVDIHTPSLDTFACNTPFASTICGDIRGVDDALICDALGQYPPVDVVTAGVPCQGFSRSNRKRHDDDKRNFLFHEFIRIARLLSPRAVVLENVGALAQSARGAFKQQISEAITGLGLTVHVCTLNAADYGVAQQRQRIFFVGVRPGMTWKWPTPNFGPSSTRGTGYRTVRDAIGDLPPLQPGAEATEYSSPPQSELQVLLRGQQALLLNHKAPDHPPETIERIRRTKPGEPMYEEFRQRIRLHLDRPSPTQVCGGIRPQFQFGHPGQPRGLSIRERARIQSFPDKYHFLGGLVQGRVQTGNAVPPLLAQALAEKLKEALGG